MKAKRKNRSSRVSMKKIVPLKEAFSSPKRKVLPTYNPKTHIPINKKDLQSIGQTFLDALDFLEYKSKKLTRILKDAKRYKLINKRGKFVIS